MTKIIAYYIMIFGGFNLIRIATMLIATDLQEIREHRLRRRKIEPKVKNPWISVILPAYNEELVIASSLKSVCANKYPHYEVIVVDDGSKDATSRRVRAFIKRNPASRVKLVRQKNAGKAHALNNAIAHHARGSLVMCLDADSTMAPDAIENSVRHFQRNPKLVAMASNVHILPGKTGFAMMQKFEYLLSYRLKRALNYMHLEYIIGGVGSTFKKEYIKKVGLYDTDTMTEDIDLTMKIIALGNKRHEIGYGYDVHTYTQGVLNFKDLVKQRFRWKFGRMQSFLKNRELFFNRHQKYRKGLTFYQLPYAIFGEFSLLLEPILVTFVVATAIAAGDGYSLIWMFGFMMLYMGAIILGDREISLRQRLILMLQAPLIWPLFYILSAAEFAALIKCLIRLPKLRASMQTTHAASWDHVTRTAL